MLPKLEALREHRTPCPRVRSLLPILPNVKLKGSSQSFGSLPTPRSVHATTTLLFGGLIYSSHYLLGKGGYVFGGLSICLWTTLFKSYEWTVMKRYGGVLRSTVKYWLNYVGDVGILRWVNELKKHHNGGSIPRSWCRQWSKTFGVSLSQPRLNIITLGKMGVMICLGQGCLHSPSASSYM